MVSMGGKALPLILRVSLQCELHTMEIDPALVARLLCSCRIDRQNVDDNLLRGLSFLLRRKLRKMVIEKQDPVTAKVIIDDYGIIIHILRLIACWLNV